MMLSANWRLSFPGMFMPNATLRRQHRRLAQDDHASAPQLERETLCPTRRHRREAVSRREVLDGGLRQSQEDGCSGWSVERLPGEGHHLPDRGRGATTGEDGVIAQAAVLQGEDQRI
jgi:hypothetical protein